MTERKASVSSLSSRDPFELDRLAEELASREGGHDRAGQDQFTTSGSDLPEFVPLSHSNPFLSAPDFNVEEFLLSRSYTSLPDLRAELRDYLATLKDELVRLINDDYEAFISLSTDLRGEGARMERMGWPLGGLKAQIEQSREQLQSVKNAVQNKLDRRAELREEKALLQLLLKLSDSITRLESLLLISNPADGAAAAEVPSLELSARHQSESDSADDKTRMSRAKHLLRTASEFNQLLYNSEKASSEGCAFIKESQWRIDRIKSTLSSDIEHLFATTLTSLVSTSSKAEAKPEVERRKLLADINDCLRSYDMLGLWRDAEDVIRKEVVRDFVRKTVFPGCLAAPPSPMVPHTPFVGLSTFTSQQNPRTPYTPYTAFQSKTNPFFTPASVETSIYLLDDSDNALAALYNSILKFIDREVKPIMDAAEQVSGGITGKPRRSPISPVQFTSAVANGHPPSLTLGAIDDNSGDGFEILSNVVWAEVAQGIMDDLGSSVFAVGRPEEFRKNYETTQAFLRSLEYLAPSLQAVNTMRQHPVYESFERRWQLPVYFQLQWKDIVTKVEDALETRSISTSSKSKSEDSGDAGFLMGESLAIWKAINRCWSAEVFIPDLAHRFWRLTLQLLKRYRVWFDSSLPPFEVASPIVEKSPNTPSATPRMGTPNPSSQDTGDRKGTTDEDTLLSQFSIVMQDIVSMRENVLNLWSHEISVLLPSIEDEDDNAGGCEPVLKTALSSLTDILPVARSQVEIILSRRCCDSLAPVKSLPGQFRAASQKHMPSKPSAFVPLILRPVKIFFGIDSKNPAMKTLRDEFCVSVSSNVVDEVAAKYANYLSAMRKNQESLRRLRMGKRTGFSFFGSSNAANDDDDREEERIRKQVLLDIEAFGKDAQALGVDLSASAAYKTLNYLAHASVNDLDTPSSSA